MSSMDPGTRPTIQPLRPAGSSIGGVRPSDGTAGGTAEQAPKIRAFDQRFGGGEASESKWKRRPTASGAGAVHVKSFHCKLNNESLDYLDAQINEWLDGHPECDVKFVTTAVGEWTGKTREPNLIVQLWV